MATLIDEHFARRSSMKGKDYEYNILVEDLIDADNLCTFANFKPFDEKSEFYLIHDLTIACKYILEEFKDELIEIVHEDSSFGTIQKKFCQERKTQKDEELFFCSLGGSMWEGKNSWAAKEEKVYRNLNMAIEMRSLLLYNKTKKSMPLSVYRYLETDNIKIEEGFKEMSDGRICKFMNNIGEDHTSVVNINSQVTVLFNGTLINGVMFDGTLLKDSPVTFEYTELVLGWKQMLRDMKVGDDQICYLPPQMAYGTKAVGRYIGSNSMLAFRIKLLNVTVVDSEDGLEEVSEAQKRHDDMINQKVFSMPIRRE